jgi:hypothetical protein
MYHSGRNEWNSLVFWWLLGKYSTYQEVKHCIRFLRILATRMVHVKHIIHSMVTISIDRKTHGSSMHLVHPAGSTKGRVVSISTVKLKNSVVTSIAVRVLSGMFFLTNAQVLVEILNVKALYATANYFIISTVRKCKVAVGDKSPTTLLQMSIFFAGIRV